MMMKMRISTTTPRRGSASSLSNLEQAWAKSYIGICKKNTYFGINMKSPETDISQIIQKGMATNAECTYIQP